MYIEDRSEKWTRPSCPKKVNGPRNFKFFGHSKKIKQKKIRNNNNNNKRPARAPTCQP